MNPLNPFFAILIYLIAAITAYFINLKFKVVHHSERFDTIDGMRGFLAIGVFIHHASIWFQYLQTKSWNDPQSNLYTLLGQASVSFFFMITAFLFITKLLNADTQKFDWSTLFISRFFRLVPMYLFSILILFFVVFTIDHWVMKVSLGELLKEIFYWGTFTIPSGPLINDSSYTGIINARVVWSLRYEWLFYFSLPIILMILTRKVTSYVFLSISFIFIILFCQLRSVDLEHLLSFAGGAIAPFIIKYGSKKVNYNAPVFSITILVCLASTLLFDTTQNYVCKLLLITAFNLIALGNSVFGILKNSALKLLGEISYSTYLMHGIIIFIVMYFGYGIENAINLSSTNYCITLFLITPLVIFVSFILHQGIEKPFMNYSKRINAASIIRYSAVRIPILGKKAQ